jgi:type I restriction enzyme S subunit
MNRWPTKPLNQLATDLQPGFACRPSEKGSEVPQIRPLNLSELGTLVFDGTKSVECSTAKAERYSLIPGDVLFNNTNSPELVGKVAMFKEAGHFVFSNHITRIRPKKDILLPEFLHRFLFKNWFDGFFQHHCTQWVNQAAFNADALAKLSIPVPPLAEQQRIVKLLDEAHELRRLRAQADRRTADLIPALFHEMFGDLPSIEKKWPKKSLGAVATRITKGESPGWQGFNYVENGPIFITSENVLWGSLDVTEPKRIPPAFHQKLSRSSVRGDDVLLNLVGASIGRCSKVPSGLGEANINQAVAVISCGKQILPEFLANLLLSQKAQNYFHGEKVEGARANISLSNIREYEAILPPLTIQQEFTERVTEIRELEAKQAASRQRLDALFESMLHRAFRGEL